MEDGANSCPYAQDTESNGLGIGLKTGVPNPRSVAWCRSMALAGLGHGDRSPSPHGPVSPNWSTVSKMSGTTGLKHKNVGQYFRDRFHSEKKFRILAESMLPHEYN